MTTTRFVGVDLSTVQQARQGKTRVAVAEATHQGLRVVALFSPPTDEDLVECFKTPFALCGVDAPLSMPSCVSCRALPCDCPYPHWLALLNRPPQDAYHYRLSDLVVRESMAGILPKPPLSHGGPVDITPLTLRWQRVVRILWQEEIPLHRIVEVYATGSIQLYARATGLVSGHSQFRYRASIENRACFLSHLQKMGRIEAADGLREDIVASEDALDAVMAALSAWHAAQRTVFLPEALLGLDATAGPGREPRPFDKLPRAERMAMMECLYNEPWVMLPDLSSQPMNQEERHLRNRQKTKDPTCK